MAAFNGNLNGANAANAVDLNRLFEDDSDESDFDGFTRDEIQVHRDTDSGSELDMGSDSDEHGSDLDIGDQHRDFAAQGPWVAMQAGDVIQRVRDIPQHASDVLRPTKQYNQQIPSEIDTFSELFTDPMLGIMVRETNRYAAQWKLRPNLERDSRMHKWVDTTVDEMKAFIALRIAMGLSPRNQAGDYFSSVNSFWLTDTPNYVHVMKQHRFEDLTACLHFADNEAQQPRDRQDPQYNPLYKIQPLIDIVIANWRSAVQPAKHASIDESMIPFRGRVGIRQYIKSKHHRYGVKAFALCDATTCYCIKYDLYTGGYFHYNRDLGQGCSVVLKLARGLPEGTIFYTDSFYTSPTLATQLMQMKMGLVGTVQKNRRGMPDALKAGPTQDAKFVFKDPIIAVSFKDRNDVRMLSTVHHGAETEEHETRANRNERRRNLHDEHGMIRRHKPLMTGDYNSYMRGVDGLDQLASYNAYPHRTRKWYIKVFNYILDISMINGRILLQLQTGTKISATAYREHLIDQLLAPYLQANNIEVPRHARAVPNARHQAPQPHGDLPRLEGMHHIEIRNQQRKCIACERDNPRNKKVRSRYFCATCPDRPVLCLDQCFRRYHSQEDYYLIRPAPEE